MRTAAAVAVVTLALGAAGGAARAQTDETPALAAIYMIDAATGWAVAHGRHADLFLRTVDGGTHWNDVTPYPFYFSTTNVAVFTTRVAWVGTSGTADGGLTWRSDPAAGGTILAIDFINARDGWLLSGRGVDPASTTVSLYRTSDGGDTWTAVTSDRSVERAGLTENGFLQAAWAGEPHVRFLNAVTGWITRSDPLDWDNSSYLYATHSGGSIWERQKLPPPALVRAPWGSGILPPKFLTARDGVLPVFYASLNRRSRLPIGPVVAVLYLTHDQGRTWTYTSPIAIADRLWGVDADGHALWDASVLDMNRAWIADLGELFATVDGGRSWVRIRPGPLFDGVRRLDFVSSAVGWAVRQAPPHLLRTADGGRTWAPVGYTVSR